MKNQSFHEYMNSKGKITAPIIKNVADITDPVNPPENPKNGAKYKCSDGKMKKASEKGFAHMGDQKLKYIPDTDDSHGKSPAKLPTAEAVQQANKIIKDMFQNPALIEHLVRQMKNNGLLGALVAEVFEQKESAGHLAAILVHENYGPKLCRNLNHAMNEEVAQPFSGQLQGVEDEDQEDLEDNPDEELGTNSDLDVGMAGDEDPNAALDPNMMDPTMGDPSMDPNMMGDPSQMGMDPTMGDPSMDPNMMQNPQPMPLTMKKFQRAMMRAYQRAMMRKD